MDISTEINNALTATGFPSCYGCAKCTAGCPVADQMDIKPHQAMRLLQLGRAEELVPAGAQWKCVGCQTCLARCPNRVDIPAVWTHFRGEALRQGRTEQAGTIPLLDELMLGAIRRRGRVNDSVMAMRFKLRAGGLLKDWRLGLKMWKTGKLRLFVPGVKDAPSVERLFEGPASHGEESQ